MGDFCCVVVVSKVDEVSVDEGVVDVSVPENLHNVEDVFRFMVFNCGFVMAECMKADLR